MDVAKPPANDTLARLASGIEAGVIGGLAMLGLLVSGSLLRGHVWWETLNLFGSTFYSSRAFRAGPGMATISGAALHFTIAGIVGAFFGLTCGVIRERRHLVPVGMLAGLAWYYIANAVFWQHVNPLVPLYMGSRYGFQSAAVLSHLVFGACLGSMGSAGGGAGGGAGRVRPSVAPAEPAATSQSLELSVSPESFDADRLHAGNTENADNSDAA